MYRLVPGLGTTYDGVGGWGGMLRSCELAEAVDATHTRGGVGGMGWDVNVHVNLQMMQMKMKMMMVMTMMMMMMIVWCDVMMWWCDDDDDDDDVVVMMMMMTLMKLVNSGTKFRPGIDKFYQPNSGCAQFQDRGRGYIYIHVHVYIYIYTLYITLFI